MYVRSGRRGIRGALFALAALIGVMAAVPAPALGIGQILEGHNAPPNVDTRTGRIRPTSAQLTAVERLGASARWNRFGTPSSLIRYNRHLASGIQADTAAAAARKWVSANKALFRLSSVTTSNLETWTVNPLVHTNAAAVIFRQRFGALAAGVDGLITVGVQGSRANGWKVFYVSSSAAGTQAAPPAAQISAKTAWRTAAASVGHAVPGTDVTDAGRRDGWTMFDVEGLSHQGRARLVAVPVPGKGVRPAYETIVLHVADGHADAYTHFVDAVNGSVLVRHTRVNNFAQEAGDRSGVAAAVPTTQAFQGTMEVPNEGDCGPFHGPYTAPMGTQQIVVAATSPGNDIILELHKPQGNVLAISDIPAGPNPEVIDYRPISGTEAGDYFVRVCPFEPGQPAPGAYIGSITMNDVLSPEIPFPPRWRYFTANPPLNLSDNDTRIRACWKNPVGAPPVPHAACRFELDNLAARAPWDHNVQTNLPNFTTIGNAANTAEAWFSPLTPAEQYRPVATNRQYDFPWTNAWNNLQCSQVAFGTPEIDTGRPLPVGGGNDINAAIVNLFAQHNRMHDWSYFLGFTEYNFNMQQNNFGRTQPGMFPGKEGDPETGNAQAGAFNGGFPAYLGRDNANQITFNDGIPGITNMYLWQPIASAFYSPCVDGDYDMSVIGHEYTHAISTRMVGGADAGITSDQGGAMGESWSDLAAVEYLNALGYVPTNGESPFAVGPYVTGHLQRGIRNYNMSNSPLNYGAVGYDFVCNDNLVGPPLEPICTDDRDQVHADGEIWSATNFDIRQALIQKYNSQFPASNRALQERCAFGTLSDNPNRCPGNRRWIQIVFDSFLLQQADTSMLDARDAMLQADLARFGGANQRELWLAFARRGMGQFASTPDASDADPTPDFRSPLSGEGQLRFVVRDLDQSGAPLIRNANVYVGRYEAAVTAIADTDPATALDDRAMFVPGTYQFVVQADGYGLQRFSSPVQNGVNRVINIYMRRNHASANHAANPATVTADGVDQVGLIDDTEATNWTLLNRAPNVRGAAATVDLAGTSAVLVDRVRVSAMLRPARDDEDAGQNRFSALRSFEIYACRQSVTSDCATTGFVRVGRFVDAFPSVAPRPVAPDLIIREFNVTDTMATHVRLVALDNQCTSETTDFEGEQDADPINDTDCDTAVFRPGPDNPSNGRNLRVAELQVISGAGVTTGNRDPVVAVTMSGPLTADQGQVADLTTTYTNLGPETASNGVVTNTLPQGATFVSASGNGTYNATTRTVRWSVGNVLPSYTGSVRVRVRVNASVATGTVLPVTATFAAPLTVATPGALAITVI